MRRNRSTPEQGSQKYIPPVVVAGGTLAPEEAVPLYAPLLLGTHSAGYSPKKRYKPLEELGLGEPDAAYEHFVQELEPFQDLPVKPIGFGHSQGGDLVNRAAVDGYLSAAFSVGGPNMGMRDGNLTSLFFTGLLRKHHLFDHFHEDSDHIQGMHDDIKNKLQVPLHWVSPTIDEIVYLKYQHGLENTENLHQWHLVPKLGRVALSKLAKVPEYVTPLVDVAPSEHLGVAMSPALVKLVRKVQEEVAIPNDFNAVA